MKNPYDYLFSGMGFVFIDLSSFGLPDILPDFIGYLFFAYGIHLLPSFHNLKRWSKNFAIILMVMSFFVELDQWLGYQILGEIGIQFMQFLFIIFMYYVFQLLLHIHNNKALEVKTFKTYQKFMAFMLCGFVIQAFSINFDASMRENVHLIGSLLQLFSFVLFINLCRTCHEYFKKIKENKVHSLE
ncbi:hypothetical protein FJQ98_23500 [Lysinibacillus agricola]|uniref:Uncharacterized protein n=1 Tax=Lysinibacillus agricola TaxID=2590012 RepID=A0ABX7ARX3_9BACI|nr:MULTISPECIES: hypothetical protein [Lysinibacillus]KOS62285.1 hypothetical protein AN161_13285 [Lysinibacillus sp. FJAT-14222]QQP12047.1 hypothetical protein FJQ98_23500 [Lysinibacillus agricola]